MAIPLMEEDVEVISKLGDVPGSDDGLSTAQLKARFDLAAVRIKRYINETMLPHLNQLVDVKALLNGILDSTLSLADKAANAKATGDALAKKLDKTGGNVTGNIDMGGKRIGNLGNPVSDGDAVHKKHLEDRLKEYSSTRIFTLSLPASGWSASAPYTQSVAVSGVLSTDMPHWGVAYSDEVATALAQKEAFAVLDDLDTADGSVTFTCFEDKPEIDLTIRLEVNR